MSIDWRHWVVILGMAGGLLQGAPAVAGEVLDGVLARGELRIPNEPDWPPYSFTDAQGHYTGFDVEVAREVARRLGVELRVVDKPDGSNFTWDEQTSGGWNGAYDAVIGSMTPTAKRDEQLDFPAIYYYAIAALAVHRDNRTIHTPADASGKRIGVLQGSNYEYYVRRQPFGITGMEPVSYAIDNPQVITYEKEKDAFDALARGDGVELDALINYLPVIMDLIKEGKPFKVVGKPLYRVPQSIAIAPGDPEFAARLAKIVEDMHGDGTLSRLSLQWVGFDMTR